MGAGLQSHTRTRTHTHAHTHAHKNTHASTHTHTHTHTPSLPPHRASCSGLQNEASTRFPHFRFPLPVGRCSIRHALLRFPRCFSLYCSVCAAVLRCVRMTSSPKRGRGSWGGWGPHPLPGCTGVMRRCAVPCSAS